MSYHQQCGRHIMISMECNDAKNMHIYCVSKKSDMVIYSCALQCSNAGEVVVLLNMDEIAIMHWYYT